MYYYNQNTSYDSNHKQQGYYQNQNANTQYHSTQQKYNKPTRHHQTYPNKNINFSSRFEYENNNSRSYSTTSPPSFIPNHNNHQYYDNNNNSLSSSFDSDDSYLTASLSSSTSSLEFNADQACNASYYSDGHAIWSSALYSPNLHPALFESWSTKMNRSIVELNEELKNYNRINGNDMISNYEKNFNNPCLNTSQIENLSYMNNLINSHQHHPQQSASYCQINSQPKQVALYQNDQNLISYEEMTTKVDDLLNLSSLAPAGSDKMTTSNKGGLTDITNFHNDIHISTNSECLDGSADSSDDKSNKSVSPKLKFIAPRFEKKWLKTQTSTTTKYPVAYNTNTNGYPINCQNESTYPINCQKGFTRKFNANEVDAQKCGVFGNNNRGNSGGNKWISQSSVKSGKFIDNNNNSSVSYSKVAGSQYPSTQMNSKNYSMGNENEISNSGNNNNNGYRSVRSKQQQTNNRYRNRASSKSRT